MIFNNFNLFSYFVLLFFFNSCIRLLNELVVLIDVDLYQYSSFKVFGFVCFFFFFLVFSVVDGFVGLDFWGGLSSLYFLTNLLKYLVNLLKHFCKLPPIL